MLQSIKEDSISFIVYTNIIRFGFNKIFCLSQYIFLKNILKFSVIFISFLKLTLKQNP